MSQPLSSTFLALFWLRLFTVPGVALGFVPGFVLGVPGCHYPVRCLPICIQ